MTRDDARIARSPDDVFRFCNPEKPLQADDAQWYVDLSAVRGTKKLADSIARQIRRSQPDFHQQLVTGHRGCGKSTELLRLKATLEHNKFFTVYVDVEDVIDLVEITYLDVLLTIARAVEEQTRERGFTLNSALMDDLYLWFADKVVEQEQQTGLAAELKTQANVEGGIPLLAKLLARFTAEIKTASSHRTTTRLVLERELPVFVDKLNVLIDNARQQVRKKNFADIVIIVDGLEKMHYRLLQHDDEADTSGAQPAQVTTTHDMLFLHHAEQLKAPRCHLVYTVPISLAFNANLRDVFDIVMIPMVKATDEGLAKLTDIIESRVNVAAVFESPDLLRKLVRLSGGVVRDLMHLMRLASDTDNNTIGSSEVDYACKTLIKDYDRTLRNADIDALRQVHRERRVQADKRFERLLNLRTVLEYENGARWATIHPAVLAIDWVKDKLKNVTKETESETKAESEN